MCSCAAELAAEAAQNHATSVDLQTCVGRCCLQTVWHAPYSPSSPVSWLTGHCDHDSPHQSHKQTPTDGRETKFSPQSVTANQRGNTGITSSDNLEIISTLNRCWSENIFGHLEKNILVIVIKNYWHFSWISWRSQRNITKVWWWHVHPGGDIRHWWWGWWN